MDQKYLDIPQNFSVFEGFPIILEKEGNGPKVTFWSISLLVRFRVEAFPLNHL